MPRATLAHGRDCKSEVALAQRDLPRWEADLKKTNDPQRKADLRRRIEETKTKRLPPLQEQLERAKEYQKCDRWM